ncbi:MAG: hypothetical protein LBT39_00655, partial [Treponema sp.]|nr:hypothetical protein [Treponema sp.]
MNAAIALRSGALFLIFCQIIPLAGDLAEPLVCFAILLAGFLAPVFCAAINSRRNTAGAGIKGTACSLVILALLPWIARLLISLPRIFIPGPALVMPLAAKLDGLLLGYDRNLFVALAPYYWIALSTYVAGRSRNFLRSCVGVDLFILLAMYSIAHTGDISWYRWPVVMIAVFGSIGFLELAALIWSLPPAFRLRRAEKNGAAVMLFFLVALGSVLFIRPSQEKAVEQG